jgi:hypothetical protein
VYSSPKPTQPESNTIGELNGKPQNSTCKGFDCGLSIAAAFYGNVQSDSL